MVHLFDLVLNLNKTKWFFQFKLNPNASNGWTCLTWLLCSARLRSVKSNPPTSKQFNRVNFYNLLFDNLQIFFLTNFADDIWKLIYSDAPISHVPPTNKQKVQLKWIFFQFRFQ